MITSSSSTSPLDADLPPNYGDRRRPSEYEHERTTAGSDRYGDRKGEREEDEEEYLKEGEEDYEESRGGQRFVLDRSVRVIKTEAGEMRVLPLSSSDGDRESRILLQNGVALGFLSLEPKALLLPHYTDTDRLFVVYKGNRILYIHVGSYMRINMKMDLTLWMDGWMDGIQGEGGFHGLMGTSSERWTWRKEIATP